MNFTESRPKLARFTSSGEIIKDHHYYSGNDISWNKSALVSSKMYTYYHKLNDVNQKRVDGMNKVELYEKELVRGLQRERALKAREEGLARHAMKVKEREVIDRKCSEAKFDVHDMSENGMNGPDILDIVAKRANSFKHARSKDISWNFLDKASEKQIKQILVPSVLKGEEEMIKHIHKQVIKEHDKKQRLEQNKAEFRNKLISELHNRHEKTYELEERVGTMSVKGNKDSFRQEIIRYPSDARSGIMTEKDRHSPSLSLERTTSLRPVELRLRFKDRTSRPDRRPSQTSIIPFTYKQESLDNIEEPGLKKVLDIVQFDIKGTLVKNMEKGTFDSKNPFHKKLANGSHVFQDILEENKRERMTIAGSDIARLEESNSRANTLMLSAESRERLPSISSKNVSQNRPRLTNERKATINEIDSFEKTFNSTLKAHGHGRVVLEEANRMCTSIGLVSPQEFMNKRLNSVV